MTSLVSFYRAVVQLYYREYESQCCSSWNTKHKREHVTDFPRPRIQRYYDSVFHSNFHLLSQIITNIFFQVFRFLKIFYWISPFYFSCIFKSCITSLFHQNPDRGIAGSQTRPVLVAVCASYGVALRGLPRAAFWWVQNGRSPSLQNELPHHIRIDLGMVHHQTINCTCASITCRYKCSGMKDLFCTLRNMSSASMYVWSSRKRTPADSEAVAQSR